MGQINRKNTSRSKAAEKEWAGPVTLCSIMLFWTYPASEQTVLHINAWQNHQLSWDQHIVNLY